MSSTPTDSTYASEATAGGSTQRWTRCLYITVVVAALAVAVMGGNRFATLGAHLQLPVSAGVVAGVGLCPGQVRRGWIVAALSVTGFAVVTALWLSTASDRTLAAVTALSALQALAAVGALLIESKAFGAHDADPDPASAAYARLVEAYQDYVVHYQHRSSERHGTSGKARARADAEGTAAADVTAPAQEYLTALQARYIQHDGEGVSTPVSHSQRRAPTTPAPVGPGVPEVNRVTPPAQPIIDNHQIRERTSPSAWS